MFPNIREMMKQTRLPGIALWACGVRWRGVFGALVAIFLLIDPVRTGPPPPAGGREKPKQTIRQIERLACISHQ